MFLFFFDCGLSGWVLALNTSDCTEYNWLGCIVATQPVHALQDRLECGAEDVKGTRNKYLNKSVVQQEHDCGQIPDNPRIPEQILANIAHVTDFWMSQTESPTGN